MRSSVMTTLRAALLFMCATRALGHGRLEEPPSRSSMWRYGFKNPANYNDNELFCGGVGRQWERNGGRCGVCGDPWDEPRPRRNENGGRYGNGIISRHYRAGQAVNARVYISANHKGYFEFKLCQHDAPGRPEAASCFRPLKVGTGGTRRRLEPGNGKFSTKVYLPKSVTCSHCVFMWRYVAGNNWGRCSNGTVGMGCGPQEEFRGCSDISISKTGHSVSGGQAGDAYPGSEENEIDGQGPAFWQGSKGDDWPPPQKPSVVFPGRPSHDSNPWRYRPWYPGGSRGNRRWPQGSGGGGGGRKGGGSYSYVQIGDVGYRFNYNGPDAGIVKSAPLRSLRQRSVNIRSGVDGEEEEEEEGGLGLRDRARRIARYISEFFRSVTDYLASAYSVAVDK